jgi:hypothetical protein
MAQEQDRLENQSIKLYKEFKEEAGSLQPKPKLWDSARGRARQDLYP